MASFGKEGKDAFIMAGKGKQRRRGGKEKERIRGENGEERSLERRGKEEKQKLKQLPDHSLNHIKQYKVKRYRFSFNKSAFILS